MYTREFVRTQCLEPWGVDPNHHPTLTLNRNYRQILVSFDLDEIRVPSTYQGLSATLFEAEVRIYEMYVPLGNDFKIALIRGVGVDGRSVGSLGFLS